MKFFFLVFFLISLFTSSAFSVSPKTLKALESCGDYKWNTYKTSHRETFEKARSDYEIAIKKAKEDGFDNIVEFLTEQLEKHNKAGKEAYNVIRKFQINFTKQKLKKKLSESAFYETYFSKCEKERQESPITFDTKWG